MSAPITNTGKEVFSVSKGDWKIYSYMMSNQIHIMRMLALLLESETMGYHGAATETRQRANEVVKFLRGES